MAERVIKVKLRAQVSEYEQGMLAAARATRTVGTASEKLEQKRQAFERVGQGLVLTGAALTAVTALSVKAAMDWQSAWAGVTKTVEGTPEELARVEERLRGLTSVLPASHEEIAAVAEAAGQLGIETPNVVAFTRTMIDLGETTNFSANAAATALARFMNIMGTSQDQVDNLGSAIVGLGNNYATTESEILEMSMRLAGAGKQIGLSEGDVLGLATALSSVGIEAEAGGSAMSKVMIDIAASVDAGGERLEMFARAAGVSADQFAQKWKSDPAAALALFVKGLANAESQGKSTIGILSDLGITEVRMRDALLRSSAAADMFSTAMSDGNQAFEENTALAAEAAKRYETVESQVRIAGNSVRNAAIDFGSVFLPAVAGAAKGVSNLASLLADLPEPVQGIISVAGAAVGVIALTAGTALSAVPKIAALKSSFEELKISWRTAGLVGGGVVLALTALVAVVGSVASAQAQAQAKAEAYADTLAEGSNKITKATREMALEALQANSKLFGMFDLGGLSAADAAEKLGLNLGMVTDAATGNVEALRELLKVQKEIEGSDYTALQEKYGDGYVLAESRINQVVDAVKGENSSIEESIRLAEQKARMSKGSAEADLVAADGINAIEEAAEAANGDLSDMVDALKAVARGALDLGDAKDSAQAAINSMRDAAEAEGAALDGSNDASIRLRDSVRSVEEAHRASAEAILQNGGILEEANASWAAGRQAVIDMVVAKGMDIDQARAWADANLGSAGDVQAALGQVKAAVDNIPPAKVIDLTVTGTSAVYNELMRVQDVLRSVTGNKSLHVSTGQGGQGGLPFATGGRVVGPGSGTSDSIPVWLSNGEHVIPASEVAAAGGHEAIERYRSMISSGTPVTSKVIQGSWVGSGSFTSQQPAMAQLPPIYIQSPVTGEYLLAKTVEITGQQIAAYDGARERVSSRGVRF